MFAFSAPYPDELLSSAIIRGCRHHSLSFAAVARQLHGKKGWQPTFHSLGDLERLAELFLAWPVDLLWSHTTFPYAGAFTPEAALPVSREGRLESFRASHRTLLQGAVAGSPDRRYARWCPICTLRDLKTLGESYWHRNHQLPGVLLCPEHMVPLAMSNMPSIGRLHTLALPQDFDLRPNPVHPKRSWHLLAVASASLLNRQNVPLPPRDSGYYRSMAEQRGWLAPRAPVSKTRLIVALRTLFGGAVMDDANLPADFDDWPSLMMQPRIAVPFVTVKHVLLEQFLLNWRPQADHDFSHRPTGPSATPSRIVDAEHTTSARIRLREIAKEGKRVSVVDWLSRAGCWQAYRHASHGELPRLARLVDDFKRGPLALRPQVQLPLIGIAAMPPRSTRPSALSKGGRSELSVPLASASIGATSIAHDHRARGNRLDLIKERALLGSKEMATRLGAPWSAMKRMATSGRIFSIRYASRDFYPAFWSESCFDRSQLEALAHQLLGVSGSFQYAFFATVESTLGTSPLTALAEGRFQHAMDAARLFAAAHARYRIQGT